MRRSLSAVVILSIAMGSFPGEAAAQVIKTTLSINPLSPAILPANTPFPVGDGLTLSIPSISLSLQPSIALPNPSPLIVNAVVAVTPKATPEAVIPVAAVVVHPMLNVVSAQNLQTPHTAPALDSVRSLSATALFDGASLHAAAGDSPSDPDSIPEARAPRRRDLSRRFTSRLARWTGAAALWSVYRDGVLVQRHAARLNDLDLSPSRRALAARLLGSLGRIETLPALGAAAENDPSDKVRRVALEALVRIARAAEPKLIRKLKTHPLSTARERAATLLAWVVGHSEATEAVEALAAAGMLDPSEDARLAAIRSLSLAISPKALTALSWMLARETRPHMRSALELAVAEARGRRAGIALHAYQPPDDELSDASGPLHEVALKRALAVASVFVAVEVIGGLVTGNVALKADSMHLAADQLINGAALFSIWISRRPPNSRKSYGYLKVESVVGLLGAATIALMGFEMGVEAWHRLFSAGAPATWSVALFALASLASNLFTALILWRHHGESLSMKGAFLHSATDAVGSLGVIVSVAAAILLGWAWVEPAAVALILVMIVKTAWELGKPAWDVLIDAVPAGIDLDRVEADLLAIPGAAVVKDLHVWSLNSRTKALTATVLIRAGADHDEVLASAKAVLREKHGIGHMTVQVETLPAAN